MHYHCTCLCWLPAPAGLVQLPSTGGSSSTGAGGATPQDGALPFLFDVAGMPDEATACSHCQDESSGAVQCCGVCVFDNERCETLYPGENKSAAVAALLMGSGFQLQVGRLLQAGMQQAALWLASSSDSSTRTAANHALRSAPLSLPGGCPSLAAAPLPGLPCRPQAFSPCELFARIRGRTLWFMGDSQTWGLYSAAECFLHEFALTLERM